LVSNNSKEALEILETIENKTWTIKRTYQKVALKRALELFGSGKWEESLANLNKSLTYPIDAGYQAEALFWKMETQFKLNNFIGSQESGKLFLSALSGKVKVAPNTNAAFANYTLGYNNLKTSNYKTALNYFETALTSFNNLPANLKTQRLYQNAFNDLLVRTGDAHFAGNNYVAATDFYNRAINQNANNQDISFSKKR
jgi:tetratricopeptide (TPR) repeat protein